MHVKNPLPVDALIPAIHAALREGNSLILQAAPGSGKTTRVPRAILPFIDREILVLEPRRLAARLSAERVAEELGETTGETVGFHIRYQTVAGPRTRLRFITEGLFVRLLMHDPFLSSVGCVVIDEFHERHLQTDVALALVRHLQKTVRPDLKLIVMSATLEAGALQTYLSDSVFLKSDTRVFPVSIQYADQVSDQPLHVQVYRSIVNLLTVSENNGHVLVFLPGSAEIRKCEEALREPASKHNLLVLPLTASLPPEEQRKVFAQTKQRKVILSTNVAETSITIDGVTVVIDSGLARIAGQDPWSGLPTLHVRTISQSSCIQRTGRAGRTAPGVGIRLFTAHDFGGRRTAEKPEIQRLDLSQLMLELKLVARQFPPDVKFDLESLPWLEQPSQSMIQSSRELLVRLGAIDPAGDVTEAGRQVSQFALHPRLGRVLSKANELGFLPQAILAVSLLNEEMLLKRGVRPDEYHSSDLEFQMDLFRKYSGGSLPLRFRTLIHRGQFARVHSLAQLLCRQTRCSISSINQPLPNELLMQAVLCGFPDRVARVRPNSRGSERIELDLCIGGRAVLSPDSVVRDSEWLLALEAESSRRHGAASSETHIRVASGIEKEALLLDPAGFLKETKECFWDKNHSRVRGERRLRYGTLIVEETAIHGHDPEFEKVLCGVLREQWPGPFEDTSALQFLQQRCEILKQANISVEIPDFAGDGLEKFLQSICENKSSFAEVARKDLTEYLREMIAEKTFRLLREYAPEQIELRSGRKVQVHYESGKPPWIASRMQDFFGMASTPTIAKGRIPLALHLLAPSGRPVQVTQDLAGFWKRHYPDLRKQLSRRYPKHSWPENPLPHQN